VARQSGAPSGRQKLEPVDQPRQNPLDAEGGNPRCGKLQGERHSVQSPADRAHVADHGVPEVELGDTGGRPLDEELNRPVRDRRLGVLYVGRWDSKGRKTVNMLALSAERLLSRHQNMQVPCILKDRFYRFGNRLSEVLAIVDDQEKVFVAQRCVKPPDGTSASGRRRQACLDRRPNEIAFGDLRHLCQIDAIREHGAQTPSNLDG
jgi:hypothetical protein